MVEDEYIVDREYNIRKLNGTKLDKDATYFVIRVDAGQPEQKAILTYSRLIEKEDKTLAICIWALARHYSFQSFKNNNIKQKYIVTKKDGSPIDPKAKYFVFRIDKDKIQRTAVEHYAALIESTKPRMARQLKELVDARTWERFGLSQKRG